MLLESPALLAAGGTTGLRTWEAALFLGAFLWRDAERWVRGRKVFELGAGTGLVGVLCARYLDAAWVLATDGSAGVVEDLSSNVSLNGLEGCGRMGNAVLKWGHALVDGIPDGEGDGRSREEGRGDREYDLILGADVVLILPFSGSAPLD